MKMKNPCLEPNQQEAFIRIFESGLNAEYAAQEANTDLATVLRCRAENPDFAAAWDSVVTNSRERFHTVLTQSNY